MILIISSVFPPEPVVSASISYDLSSELAKTNQVVVLSPRPTRPMGYSFLMDRPSKINFEHIILKSYTCPKSRLLGRLIESYSFGKYAISYIKENHSDIKCIYLNGWPLLSQLLILRTSIKYAIPLVNHVVDIYPEAFMKRLSLFKKIFYKFLFPIDKYIQQKSSDVVTISQNMRRLLIETRGLNPLKVHVVHVWQNEEWFFECRRTIHQKQEKTDFTFMFLGSLSHTASIHYIIDAFQKSCLRNARLVIAGNGSDKNKLIAQAEKFIEASIEFWDAPSMDVPKIQDKADVLILSLKKGAGEYGLPSKLSAYMFSEKPIIACVESDSDTANAIITSNCGWVVSPENIEELVKVFTEVITTPQNELYKRGKNGCDFALQNFSRKSNRDKLVRILNNSILTT